MANRVGFTLVELLVVIGIVGVLVALLMPALSRVRKQAAMVSCCTNLRQIGAAWTMYLNDSRGRFPQLAVNLQWFYGGKQPCGFDAQPGSTGLGFFLGKKERLLNPYIGSQRSQEQRAAVFRCPRDGPIQGSAGNPTSATKSQDTFDYWGNSYMLNPALLTNPSTTLTNVKIPSSSLVIIGDCEWYYLMSGANFNADFHQTAPKVNIAFLDGHAATITMTPRVYFTSDYSTSLVPTTDAPPF